MMIFSDRMHFFARTRGDLIKFWRDRIKKRRTGEPDIIDLFQDAIDFRGIYTLGFAQREGKIKLTVRPHPILVEEWRVKEFQILRTRNKYTSLDMCIDAIAYVRWLVSLLTRRSIWNKQDYQMHEIEFASEVPRYTRKMKKLKAYQKGVFWDISRLYGIIRRFKYGKIPKVFKRNMYRRYQERLHKKVYHTGERLPKSLTFKNEDEMNEWFDEQTLKELTRMYRKHRKTVR